MLKDCTRTYSGQMALENMRPTTIADVHILINLVVNRC